MLKYGNTDSAISVLCRLAHVAETALSTAEIKSIKVNNIQKQYAWNKAAKSDRRIVSRARVISGKDLILLRDQREEKNRLVVEKEAKNANSKTTRKKVPSKVVTLSYILFGILLTHRRSRSSL
jgi:hypothetical protein